MVYDGVTTEEGMPVRTVKEVSKLTGVSIRTLQYYDKIGLLKATAHTQAGYRLYDDTALERLQQILLFRELEFSLKDIRQILSSPSFDRNKALDQQIRLLEMKKAHIETLIALARGTKLTGGNYMDFSAFDSEKMDAYARQARESWGETPAYREFEEKNSRRTLPEIRSVGGGLMEIVGAFGAMKDKPAGDPVVQAQVKLLQDYITEHYYNCTNQILLSLGQMYAAGGEFTENIDRAGGEGAAAFANEAIRVWCGK